MDSKNSTKLLQEVKPLVLTLKYKDYVNLDSVRKKIELYIDKIFGSTSRYTKSFKEISLSPAVSYSGMPQYLYNQSWEDGKKEIINLIETMLEDISLSELETDEAEIKIENIISQNSNIFIVHGHNEEMKVSVARIIEKLSLVPVILHEQPNKGRTIIQKFTDHSEVGFAIVLLSADDVGYSIKQTTEESKLRARQNVILELGYFLGKLGSKRVVALVESIDNFEFPSDYQGVIYIPFDKDGNWKFSLLKELKACDYNVDANKLI
jgi:predicted nucleotide-binding protein